jgi:hypothetical protein
VGWGGRSFADGNDGVGGINGNCPHTPVEVFEYRFPWHVEEFRLVNDSGAPFESTVPRLTSYSLSSPCGAAGLAMASVLLVSAACAPSADAGDGGGATKEFSTIDFDWHAYPVSVLVADQRSIEIIRTGPIGWVRS